MPEFSKQLPTVGRIVHVYYYDPDKKIACGPRAGIVDVISISPQGDVLEIAVRDDTGMLESFTTGGVYGPLSSKDRAGLGGRWAEWPPFVVAGLPKVRKPTLKEIDLRFSPWTGQSGESIRLANAVFQAIKECARELVHDAPACPELELALQALEQAATWSVKAIARHGAETPKE